MGDPKFSLFFEHWTCVHFQMRSCVMELLNTGPSCVEICLERDCWTCWNWINIVEGVHRKARLRVFSWVIGVAVPEEFRASLALDLCYVCCRLFEWNHYHLKKIKHKKNRERRRGIWYQICLVHCDTNTWEEKPHSEIFTFPWWQSQFLT